MPSCSAKNCRNRTEQGFRLFRFPADEKRKQIWIKQCVKYPKEYSRLCEFHFDDSQFENKRQDGRRKLKPNAIPTIFINEKNINEVLQDKTKVLQEETESSIGVLSKENIIDQKNIQHYNQSVPIDTETQTEVYNNVAFNTIQFSDKDGTIRQANEIKYLKKKLVETIKKNNELTLKFKREKLLRLKHDKAHKNLKKYMQYYLKNIEIPFLKEFKLGLTNQRANWSPQCLKLAMQIRYTVGWKAYLFLKKNLKLPLPSYSTLCRLRLT
ncbi:THAP domain-containing protein 2 [Monomorium pharaonis]|uniref:THAP domain-containing protein 2 n=1 Tax=Monomorium pharaonis TaxID=307658 RepID=UPI001746CBB7|nr:THAP domain-containing protein 2 [Monomorium pharaonis]